MRSRLSLDTLRIESDALASPSSIGGFAGFRTRLYAQCRFEVGFFRDGANDALLDLGSDLGGTLLVKRSTGTQRFDEAALASVSSFTRTYETTTYVGTFTAAASDVITLAAHGLKHGSTFMVSTAGTLPAGLSANTVYYARDVTTNTLTASLTKGGAAVNITDAGTGTHSLISVGEFIYAATLDFSAPVFEKLLGVDWRDQKEQISIQCVADVSASLRGKYLDVWTSSSAYLRCWFYVGGSGSAPAAGTGGTLVQISFASDATAATIATAISVHASITALFTAVVAADTVTLTAITSATLGWHSPGSSEFTVTLETCGMVTGTVTDIESADVVCELTFDYDGVPQKAELFTFEIENTLERPGQSSPASASGSNIRSGTVAIANGTATGAVTFATPHSSASWVFDGVVVVYVGGGTPDVLAVATIVRTAATGFTYYLTGTAPDADYTLEYRTRL